ncbi:MAG TPA: hemerythrin domain-containing protein [Methylomirabilota bacterium]|jgi:hemerythrin-like domain-containing protein
MTTALSIIREEHRSLSAVTRTLMLLAREARAGGGAPDYELFTLILDYIEGFADRFHHPKEDRYLFTALRRRTREANQTLDVLERDHASGDELLRDLRYLLARCRVGGAAAIDTFTATVEEYAAFHWRHMRLEEDTVMPLAERWLTAADWEPIDAAFQANEDPLFGARPREEFRRLFGLILNRAPAPIGLGAARQST